MHLKSVEIVGFKSFAEKTRLELEPGIIAILGPNGCGKSNVMEAVRWCLGEMSWKSLRSPSMIDVIFNGNAKRSPLSMAEVTLTFDNASKQLPVDFTEVSITRRIYRSGESEYLLNKTACRLKDIRELFLDTGLGGDGYAIIDQGGVDFILRSKPEERRSLFEEAAGVAKYRAKREEALRKLEKVEADLARLQDSIVLINEQIKKLDSDARKAKLYQKYKDELLTQEVGQIMQEVGAIDAEVQRESAAMDPIRENLKNRQLELDAEEGRLAALRLERTQQEASVHELHQQVAALKAEIGRLEERIANTARSVEETRERQVSETREAEHASKRLEAIGPELDRARKTCDEARAKKDEAQKECDSFHEKLEAMEAGAREAQHELEEKRAQALSAAQVAIDEAGKLSREESLLGQKIYHVKQTLRELERKTRSAEDFAADTATQLAFFADQQGWLEASRRDADESARKVSELRAAHGAFAEEAIRLHAEKAQFEARLHALETQGGQDAYWAGAQAVAGAGIAGVLGTVRSLIEVESGLEAAVEDLLGERLFAVACEDVTSAQSAVEYLEQTERGRARVLVLSSLPETGSMGELPPQARALLVHLRWDPRFERGIRYLLSDAFTLDKRSHSRHWVCGGAAPAGGVSVKLTDLNTLKQGIERLEAAATDLTARRTAAEAAIVAAEERSRAVSSAFQDESVRWNAGQARCKEREEQARLLDEEISFITKQSHELLTEIAQSKRDIEEFKQSAAALKEKEAALRAEEQVLLERVNALKGEAIAQRKQESHLQDVLRQWESQVKLMDDQFNRLALEEESLKSSAQRHLATVTQMEERLKDLARVEEESKAALEGSRVELAKGEQAAQMLGSRLAELAQGAEQMEQAIHRLRGEATQLQDQLHQWDVRAGGLQTRRDSLKSRLWDEWQMTLEDAVAKYPSVAVDVEKIQTLRRRIQNMGNINLAAPEEYEALSQRHGFLLTQVADLNKAKDDLRSAITKINATTREHFRQTFTEVREHFRRIYGTLFEGGEADLVLTDQENLLETGIDIVAQPPGKRLQSLALLSGGERTLTAIALLFAFFMVKISPVCMLDEADAALDEANVERFAGMLREFAAKSQFLMISHNKRALEAADRIFGVTMEESGVSQIMSVDFRKKDAAAAGGDNRASEGSPAAS